MSKLFLGVEGGGKSGVVGDKRKDRELKLIRSPEYIHLSMA